MPPIPGPGPVAKDINITRIVSTWDDIAVPGERDLFAFVVERARPHHIEALGGTPVVLRLLGPNSETALVAETNNA